VDVVPYPFGVAGTPVAGGCGTSFTDCLQVTSLAFRAWNRGLAATVPNLGSNPFRVWLYNGTRWYPDPTYPGTSSCPGSVVTWAGKLDYWLIGQGSSTSSWAGLCRFDGANFVWQPLKLPAATISRIPTQPNGQPKPGGITSGTCFSWNNCWFFGSYGTIVHWDGTALTDASPSLPRSPELAVSYQSADSQDGVGVAVAGSSDAAGNEMPGLTPGGAPGEVFTSDGADWSSSGYSPPTVPQPANSSPYNTDLVAVSVAGGGTAWVVGDPAGWRPGLNAVAPSSSGAGARGVLDTPEPAPVEPVSVGSGSRCATPQANRFSFVKNSTAVPLGGAYAPSYLWTSVSAVPGTGTAIAGGLFRPGTGDSLEPPRPAAFDDYEPVIALVSCSDPTAATVTRFIDPSASGARFAPLEPGRGVIAVAANADNDGWAATALHLYRLTDGRPPDAPAGDDNETRPLQLKQDPPIVVFAPVPPPPPPPAAVVSATTQTLPPAVYGIKTKLRPVSRSHGKTFNLYVSFKVRRKVTLGLEATRRAAVVAKTRLQAFQPPKGQLVVKLSRAHWPTGLSFLTDTPTISLHVPSGTLTGGATLTTTASAIPGRKVASVRFDYAPAGTNSWISIGTVAASPFSIELDTAGLASGPYEFRAVVTDSAGIAAVSKTISGRVQGGTST
jgi:hypothetical protein